jgi:hypothetical protein
MQFSDPNADIYGGSPFGYAGNTGMPYMGQQRRRGRLRGCIGCLAALLILALIGALIGAVWNISIVWGPTVIQVGAHPTLIVESQGYDESVINPIIIHIHAGGSDGQIAIKTTRPLNIPFGFPEAYQESSDHLTVIYDVDPTATGTFDITVPAQTDLKVDTNSAVLQIEGVTGQMVLTTNSGTLTLNNCHVSGPSLLRSNSGAINAIQDQLSGSVALDDNSAAVTFQGSLDPLGVYRFTNNGKPISVTVPQGTTMHIDATTLNNGTITSNIPQVTAQSLDSGFDLHTDVGATPRALLSLYNNGGSITINEQGGK